MKSQLNRQKTNKEEKCLKEIVCFRVKQEINQQNELNFF